VSAKPDHLPLLVLNLKRAVSGKNVRATHSMVCHFLFLDDRKK
jgi:hypothetical protein